MTTLATFTREIREEWAKGCADYAPASEAHARMFASVAAKIGQMAAEHKLKGESLLRQTREADISDDRAKRLFRLAPNVPDFLEQCKREAAATPGYQWPGLDRALSWYPRKTNRPRKSTKSTQKTTAARASKLRQQLTEITDDRDAAHIEIERLTQYEAQIEKLAETAGIAPQTDPEYITKTVMEKLAAPTAAAPAADVAGRELELVRRA